MQRPEVDKIRWKDWNIAKLAVHGIAQKEVEQVFSRDPIWAPNPGHEDRYKMIGYTDGGRALTIIVAIIDELDVLPITGWEVDNEERARYLSLWRDDG